AALECAHAVGSQSHAMEWLRRRAPMLSLYLYGRHRLFARFPRYPATLRLFRSGSDAHRGVRAALVHGCATHQSARGGADASGALRAAVAGSALGHFHAHRRTAGRAAKQARRGNARGAAAAGCILGFPSRRDAPASITQMTRYLRGAVRAREMLEAPVGYNYLETVSETC